MFTLRTCLAFVAVASLLAAPRATSAKEGVKRVGIVGCDTSHVIVFTKLINDPKATGALAELEVTAAFPGGSPDLKDSADRLPGYVKELRNNYGLKIVDSLDALVNDCDAILLESVDGRPHLEQFRAVAKGKPVFVDKPMAVSLADVISIFRIAEETHTPVFSSSTLRFCKEVQEAAKSKPLGKILGCETAGPLKIQAHHPDLFHYGIHGVEPLFTIMGTGCESVSRIDASTATVVVGKWKDGRIGSYRGLKEGKGYAFTSFGEKSIVQRTGFSGYDSGVTEICNFFVSGKPPVGREETTEIYAFMEAADESKVHDGKAVKLSEVIARAEKAADAKSKSSTGGN